MGLFDNLAFKMWDDVGAVVSLLEKWTPENCKNEKDFENSLFEYLHKELGDIQITKQYAVGRIKADLMVGKNVIVEMKTNLKTTNAYQRLVGQLTQYAEWQGRIVIILTGQTDINLLKDLKAFVKKQNDSFAVTLIDYDRYTLFVK
jgi:histidinol phosphatase-like enzyme